MDSLNFQYSSQLAVPNPEHPTREIGLRYVHDEGPGFARRRTGSGFVYLDTRGVRLSNQRDIDRIHTLAIPPTWTNVWICPRASGHIQASGRDARGRKQYRYHPKWEDMRNHTQFSRIAVFGKLLPLIRQCTGEQLAQHGMPREKMLAVVVALLEKTLIRIGNAENLQPNCFSSLAALHDSNAQANSSAIRFSFRGKSDKYQTIDVHDRRLAAVVQQCQELPGQELFGYADEKGKPLDIDSGDVNTFLHETTSNDITAKDFRTWGCTLQIMHALCAAGVGETAAERKNATVLAIKETARYLGETAAVCRKNYIHPSVLSAYENGDLLREVEECEKHVADEQQEGLSRKEQTLLRFLDIHAITPPL